MTFIVLLRGRRMLTSIWGLGRLTGSDRVKGYNGAAVPLGALAQVLYVVPQVQVR